MMPHPAYVQVYTGNGKGKTTAAFGLALRASGHGIACYVGQFMKGRVYGEAVALRGHSRITVEQYGDDRCVGKQDVRDEDRRRARDGLRRVEAAIRSGRYGLVVLDEVNVAVSYGLLDVRELMRLLSRRPPGVELVLTGRYAPEEAIEAADLVTEFREIKHYYTRGVAARDGIER